MEKNRLYCFNCILLAHALCFLWTVNGMAQINSANLNGTVTDTSGAKVLNAKVESSRLTLVSRGRPSPGPVEFTASAACQ